MKQHDFEWTSQTFEYADKGVAGAERMAMKALGVVYKHFLVPMSNYDLSGWYKFDNYRHHLAELEEDDGDEFWIKPWLVGQWRDDKECIFQFEPGELMEEVFKQNNLSQQHKRGGIFGIYLSAASKAENWDTAFSFRLEDKSGTDKIHDLPVWTATCCYINGDSEKVEKWLDWAYTQSA